MGLMALLVLQQPHKAETVSAATNLALWVLQCASEGQLPAGLLCLGSVQALTACISACTAALHGLGLLGLFADRWVTGIMMECVKPSGSSAERWHAGGRRLFKLERRTHCIRSCCLLLQVQRLYV